MPHPGQGPQNRPHESYRGRVYRVGLTGMAASKPDRSSRMVPESLRQGKRVPLQQRINALVEAMHRCLASEKPLNFSEAAHREITEALRIVAYERGTSPAGSLLK